MKTLPGATRTWIDLSASGPFIEAVNLNDYEAKFRAVDALVQATAVAVQNAPPASPADGDVYIVGAAPTGVWVGIANRIARFDGTVWDSFVPAAGWRVAIGSSDYRWSGSAWVQDAIPSHAAQHEFGGSQPITGSNILGLRPVDSPEFLRAYIGSDILLKRSGVLEWGLQAGTAGFELASRNADWSAIDWPIMIGHAAGGVIRLGGTTNRPVNLAYSLQLGGVDTITSGREGRFTGLRLTNLSSGQIPVCSDGNGQVTPSGLTDDGSILRSFRTMCYWSTMARSGGTWTDLQWTPDAQERVSVLSSNGAGSAAYHTLAIVPPDAEATSRTLGVIAWGQKVSGKSAANAGLKAVIVADSIGAGGSVSGFGSRFRIRYMPDNGAAMVDAMRIGAFGGSTPDAVQADILLRAAAGIQTDYIRFGSETQSGNWSPTTTTKRYVKQTGAGTITLPVNCSAYAGMEFTVVMTMTSVANVFVEKDTHGTTDRYFFKDAIPSAWTDVYGFANRLIAGRSPTGGAAAGETALVHFMCDGSYWWIHCD